MRTRVFPLQDFFLASWEATDHVWAHPLWASTNSPLSGVPPDLRKLKPCTSTQRLSTVTELLYSILCINKSWLFQLSLAQRMKTETIVCYWKFKKTWFKRSFSYSTLQQKTSTGNLLPKILWIFAASPAVAMNLKLLFHNPYPILISPSLKALLKPDPKTL